MRTPTPTDIPQRQPTTEPAGAYVGEATQLGRVVVIEEGERRRALPIAEPTRGYSWGRTGASVRELARAILIDATRNEMLAERLCRPLTWEVIAQLPADSFRLSRAEVLAWVDARAEPPTGEGGENRPRAA